MSEDQGLASAQHEVQLRIGRCLLGLQQYEVLMKYLVASHQFGGAVIDLVRDRETRIRSASTKTLGQLVAKLFDSFIVGSEESQTNDSSHLGIDDVATVDFRAITILPDEDVAQMRDGLRELVQIRNELVHHFVERFDLWSIEGCECALVYLRDASDRTHKHHEQLLGWVSQIRKARAQLASFLGSEAATDWIVNGVAPDGTVCWPAAGIVSALDAASRALATEGWTSLDVATEWIGQHHPKQQPEKYGCRSWPQVLHQSKRFELRYRRTPEGLREAWFRPNARDARSPEMHLKIQVS